MRNGLQAMSLGPSDVSEGGSRAHGGLAAFLQSVRRSSLTLAATLLALWIVPMTAMAATPLRIVVLGDSLVAGYQLRAGQAFPEVLQEKLRASGRDVTITNAGVSGDTAADGLARFDWSVPEGTDLVIVELGANDMLRGHDPALTREVLDKIFAQVKQRGMGLVIAGMRAINNYGPVYQAKFDAIYPALAQKYGVPLYPFFMDGIFGNLDLLLPDKLHPNPAGAKEMVEKFFPFIATVIDAFPRPAAKAG